MMLCKKSEIPPHTHTQMSTSQVVSAHVIHKFNRQLSLFKLYSLAYPRNCNQGNFAICLFLEYLFLFSTPSTSMEVFPIMRFLSCKRWGLHRKNSVGCVFIINRPIKEELSRSKMVALWRFPITFAPLRKCEAWIQDLCTHSWRHTSTKAL